jgi:SAM-dependent methyltransferase
MSDKVFGQRYADHYDLLYHDKDYEAECDLIESAFRKHSQGPVKTILDLGCGTGNHAILLARRGYGVTGVDFSEEMLTRAQEKAAALKLPSGCLAPTFVQGDVRSVDVGQPSDAVLMMFAVLGYQLTNDDVLSALRTVRRHLRPGGLFVCDVWYGPAVLAIRPSERVKVIPTADGKIIRVASGVLDTYRHLCEVRYRLWRLNDGRVVSETEESHQMRYFFPQELTLLVGRSQLEMMEMSAFGEPGRAPDEETWNVMITAQAY